MGALPPCPGGHAMLLYGEAAPHCTAPPRARTSPASPTSPTSPAGEAAAVHPASCVLRLASCVLQPVAGNLQPCSLSSELDQPSRRRGRPPSHRTSQPPSP